MNFADYSHLPATVRNRVDAELRSGERIAWIARPIPSRYARTSWGLTLFAIPWTAFSIFWIWGASQGSSSAPGPFKLFPLFGVPFLVIGFGMLGAPYWAKRKALTTAYVITDQRAIIMESTLRGSMRIQSFSPADLQTLSRNQHQDGSGDVIFQSRAWRDSDGDRRTTQVGFTGVPDVKTVEEHLRTLAAKNPLPP